MNQQVLAIIPARGGSKGIPYKNLRLLREKPLIQHAIDYAKSSKYINTIVVSTDSDKIADESVRQGVKVIKRPESLAGDRALVIDAIRHAVDECGKQYNFYPDIIVLLECTSPIKSVNEIDRAIEIFSRNEADSVATFRESAISPHRLWRVEENVVTPFIKESNPFLPRQSQPKGYQLTGQLYAITIEALNRDLNNPSILVGKVFPIITETEVIDIDQEIDLIIAEEILKYLENKN